MSETNPTIATTLLRLDAWLDTLRNDNGYSGPVTHWWQHCLQFAGAGLDWRYEGLISGYLTLAHTTGERRWLEKARRAGDDLVRGQLPTGTYRNSSFERNPYTGGTPHEAGCDAALAQLAQTLRAQGDDAWQIYAEAAERNLQNFILGVLWNPRQRRFDNTADDASFVPNKAATTSEALLAWAALTGESGMVADHVVPTLEAIVTCQVQDPSSPYDGAIPQRAIAGPGGTHYYPFYIARCIPALVQGYIRLGTVRYLEAAEHALAFILRQQLPDGSFPQVVYANSRVNRHPRWIAGAAEILRAAEDVAAASGKTAESQWALTRAWLLKGQLPSGGFRTAAGFAAQISQRTPPAIPDFADLLPVCGWNSMVLRYLSRQIERRALHQAAPVVREDVELPCLFHGQEARYHEDAYVLEVQREKRLLYRWEKGSTWATLT